MNQTKHEAITCQLRENIQAGMYEEKLPPVRSLSVLFGVTLRTMNKALKPLIYSGLVIPDGPRGIFINHGKNIRKRTNVVGIFVNDDNFWVVPDPLIESLKGLIQKDGLNPLVMNSSNPNQFSNMEFWTSNWVEGYIFAYSSINKELAYKLKQKGVPFVLANRLPLECGANWVDFDTAAGLRKVLTYFHRRGLRKIAVDFPCFELETYREQIIREWENIAKGMSLYRAEYVRMHSARGEEQIREHAKYFIELADPPEVIIVWENAAPVFEEECRKKKISVPADIQLVGWKYAVDPASPYPYCLLNYPRLAEQVWNLFKTVINGSSKEVVNELIDVEFIPQENIP